MAGGTWVTPGLDSQAQKGSTWVSGSGQVDGEALLNGWRDAGISPEMAVELLNVIMLTQSPVLARTAAVENRARRQAARTEGVFAVRTPEQAATFLHAHRVDRLAWAGVLHSEEVFNTLPGEGFDWPAVAGYWVQWASLRQDERLRRAHPASAETMAEARDALAGAATEAGLAGLRVPLASWSDPAALQALAERLRAVNRSLGAISGLEGPTLGLNGRVELTITSPRRQGMAFAHGPNWTGVAASWEDLPHEWFHALDFALPRPAVAPETPDMGLLTDALARRRARNALEEGWQRLPAHLDTLAGGGARAWHVERRQRVAALLAQGDKDARWKADYLQERREVLAFQWQAFVQSQLAPGHPSFDTAATDGRRGPRFQEATGSRLAWNQAMGMVVQMWWQPETAPAWRRSALAAPRGPRPSPR